jgi:agmatine deiminase
MNPAVPDPSALGYFMPGEWAPREATVMSWPVRAEAWLDGLEDARRGYAEVANAIAEAERLIMIVRPDCASDARARLSSAVEVWELPHDDSWVRDNAPTVIIDGKGGRLGVNWRFNAWGEKYRPYDADDALASRILERLVIPRVDAPLVLEGGSIHSDGEGTILTTEECLLNPNRNPRLTKSDIENHLRRFLGAQSFVWLAKGLPGDETDGHVDNIACFAAPGLVVFQEPDGGSASSSDAHQRLAASLDARGKKLEVVVVPEPPARFCKGERLTLSYINYYPVRGALVVPVFGRDGDASMRAADERAIGILRELYPGKAIRTIDGMKIIKGGGNVHCITQQIPAAGSAQ